LSTIKLAEQGDDDELEDQPGDEFDDDLAVQVLPPKMDQAVGAFTLDEFWRFCSALTINSKEDGDITLSPDRLLGTQIYVMEQIADGLSRGIHTFVILKGRQQGITTITLALDLYWIFRHAGMGGSMVTHDEESRDFFKLTLEEYITGLPKAFKQPIKLHNRNTLAIANKSRLSYQVAGTTKRSKGKLGRGKGLTFLHGTEVSSWGDEEGLKSLNASLAQNNLNRLFVYESTARGFNIYWDMWDTAKRSNQQMAIFVGWWRNQKYRLSRSDGPTQEAREQHQIYLVYWSAKTGMSSAERKLAEQVKALYDFDIDDEQIAWYRYNAAEIVGDDLMMMQEHPWVEEQAFINSGSSFFNAVRINDEFKRTRKFVPSSWRFVFRREFMDTEIQPCPDKLATLRVWEWPKPGAIYSVGADPAWGSSEWADRFCISVWRCYAEGMDQVAEFCTPDLNTFEFAWVLCYLAGAFTPAMINLELNGPGQAVLTEMDRLKRDAAQHTGKGGMFDVISKIQTYLYRRQDNIGGTPSAMHTKMNADLKERMMNFFKDCFERSTSEIRSPWLVDEMKNVVREDGFLGAPGRGKDDRVIAAGLAHINWIDFLRPQCIARGITRQSAQKSDQMAEGNPIFSVAHYLKKQGVNFQR
jgi:hypothetical protein